ncbi:hypothetical protein HMPREF9103_01401 [Lentilactobacillus parafarraginis F0439]|uniref:Uncharacterized protein n=1 Tax=Lentilactobacillus parafarraginis F0439 TaxID=797515 RepID=G9ZNU7_9LACO|nr:hypothetical protein HMPREF9103_01401 [Lentilactobacillus parafarraginis F0439]
MIKGATALKIGSPNLGLFLFCAQRYPEMAKHSYSRFGAYSQVIWTVKIYW